MGNSKSKLDNKIVEKLSKINEDKEQLNKNILKLELNKDSEEQQKKKEKYKLNIYIYSNEYKNNLDNLIPNYNKDVFIWSVKRKLNGFSENNSNYLVKVFEKDYQNKNFKNVLIIPIDSFENFQAIINEEEKNCLSHFECLIPEQQPFFIFITNDENDFIKKEVKSDDILLKKRYSFKEYYELYNELERNEIDFELTFRIEMHDKEEIKIFKNLVLEKKKNLDDFEIIINLRSNYITLYGQENINLEDYLKILDEDNLDFTVFLVLINQNSKIIEEHFSYYEKFKTFSYKFNFFQLKEKNLLNILENYKYLDERNFIVKRYRKSIKNELIKFTGYYNQLGDILFYNIKYFYPAKINIGVCGFSGSGKSTFINTILGEKRCLEGQGFSQTNYVSQYTIKDYPINLIDFPGLRIKKNNKDNIDFIIKNIEDRIEILEKTNDIIHCFLFCLKFKDRIFSQEETDSIKLLKCLNKHKIKTFFIVTQSEREETDNFKRYRKNIIKEIIEIKKKNPDINIFGRDEELDKIIIPIYSIKEISHDRLIFPFGLNRVFETLYNYFYPKLIKEDINMLNSTEKDIDNLINNNELLKIYKSKNIMIKGIKEKIQKELSIFILKNFFIIPKYIYNINEETIKSFLIQVLNHMFQIYKYYIGKENNIEKYRLFNQIPLSDSLIKDFYSEYNEIEKELKKEAEKFKEWMPWYVKAFFPIISPIYYVIGTPLIICGKGFISKYIINRFLKEDDIQKDINELFKNIGNTFNKAINNLKDISNWFQYGIKIENHLHLLVLMITKKDWECKLCLKSYDRMQSTYYCTFCNYNICINCKEKISDVKKYPFLKVEAPLNNKIETINMIEVHKHPLIYSMNSRTTIPKKKCNLCNQIYGNENWSFYCSLCDYDICYLCYLNSINSLNI